MMSQVERPSLARLLMSAGVISLDFVDDLEGANRALEEKLRAGLFLPMLYAVIDRLSYALADRIRYVLMDHAGLSIKAVVGVGINGLVLATAVGHALGGRREKAGINIFHAEKRWWGGISISRRDRRLLAATKPALVIITDEVASGWALRSLVRQLTAAGATVLAMGAVLQHKEIELPEGIEQVYLHRTF